MHSFHVYQQTDFFPLHLNTLDHFDFRTPHYFLLMFYNTGLSFLTFIHSFISHDFIAIQDNVKSILLSEVPNNMQTLQNPWSIKIYHMLALQIKIWGGV